MIIYKTSTAQHLMQNTALPCGTYTIKRFSDGEIYLKLHDTVSDKNVLVIASTQSPAENLIELLFLLDALNRAQAQITLCITYFGYARQIIAQEGEALSAQVIARTLTQTKLKKIYIVHPHSLLLEKYLPFTALYPYEFFCAAAQQYDAVAAPDAGALPLAQHIAAMTNKELIQITKKRPEQEQVEIVGVYGNVRNKKVLIVDDMIATGTTIISAAEALTAHGATEIAACATHGVFSGNAREILQKSILQRITVTNTCTYKESGKIHVTDISASISAECAIPKH